MTTTSGSAARADEDDERFVQALEHYDEYLADQQHAIELLKQGFLKLTMAKMNLPAHAVGELSYKDEFESALCVVVESDGTLAMIKANERDSLTSSAGENAASSSVKRRKEDPSVHQEPRAPAPSSSSGAKEEDAAIMWFSSLPPPNLRLAQKHFRSALQALLVSTATARKILHAVEATPASQN